MNKKIFISAPQHSSKMYAFNDWLFNVRNFTYKNIEIFLADNSDTEDNSILINSFGVNCSWVMPSKDDTVFDRICNSHNVCRAEFLKSDCDFWLHLETDIIPPINVIERLLSFEEAVVSAIYDIGTGKDRHLMVQLIDEHHKDIQAYRTTQFVEQEDEPIFLDGTCKKVFQCGLGCILLSREVVSMIKFRIIKDIDASADTYFFNDLWRKNIDVFIDTNTSCKHLNEDWKYITQN